MSAAISNPVPASPATPIAVGEPAPGSAALRRRQLAAIIRMELKKGFFGKRAIGLWLLALAPPAMLALRLFFTRDTRGDSIAELFDLAQAQAIFAGAIYQAFLLRVIVFLGCVGIFGNLIRREVLDRTLHYYFLAPIRREILVLGKYLTGLIVAGFLFGLSTVASFLLTFAPIPGGTRFLLQGPGLGHLFAYVATTLLACVGYGAIFLTLGFFFRSPAIPALLIFGWEGIHFLLPPLLKKASVIHYLQSLMPVPVSDGPLALLSDAPSKPVAVIGLLIFAGLLVAISARRARGMEIKYEED
ncbi:MAG TPA: ABC transporter permease [Thermoanaerobaculia bacterium]|nr:ABC transporter permease [Thermoanaerobaculia bacterium]